jgi:DNA polymerase III alpha subunit (gram-positive type)
MAQESSAPQSAIENFLDNLAALPPHYRCPKCGTTLCHFKATFFLEDGKAWNLPLSVCPKCDPE